MGKFSGKLLVTDMDGTLLSSTKHLSNENIEAIQYFVEEGGLFSIATGRIEGSVAPYAARLPVNAPAILYNGGMLYDFNKQEVIWQSVLPSCTQYLQLVLEQYPGIGVEIYQQGCVCVLAENKQITKHLHDEQFDRVWVNTLMEVPSPYQKVLFGWDPKRLDALEVDFAEMKLPCRIIRSEASFLEWSPAEVSKGHALQQLVKHLQISTEDVIAIGDHMNDLELIAVAGLGVAVENATPQLKQIAKRMSIDHDQHAVAHLIRQML
jgi:Cof subfamily protein (haloacid dehalogenase superfamily)